MLTLSLAATGAQAAGINTTRSNIKSSQSAASGHDIAMNAIRNIKAAAAASDPIPGLDVRLSARTDEGDGMAIKENGVRVTGVVGDVDVTNSTESSSSVEDNSVTDDHSTTDNSVNADSVSSEVTDASTTTDNSENTDNSVTVDNSVNNAAASDGDGAVASGGDATYSETATTISGNVLPGGAILSAAFASEAIVNVTTLSSSVSGPTVAQPAGANPQAVPVSITLSGNAQQDFAGLQNLSLNTGAAASVIQNISFAMKPPRD